MSESNDLVSKNPYNYQVRFFSHLRPELLAFWSSMTTFKIFPFLLLKSISCCHIILQAWRFCSLLSFHP